MISCLDPLTGHIYLSRHVKFDENAFPFHNPQFLQSPAISSLCTSNSHQFVWTSLSSQHAFNNLPPSPTATTPTSHAASGNATPNSSSVIPSANSSPSVIPGCYSPPSVSPPAISLTIPILPRPQSYTPPTSVHNVHPMITRSKFRQISSYLTATTTMSEPKEPKTIKEALLSPH
ncbi:hypothetical protein U1Q18_013474 [Sarracenia purpurea var. burkii]